MIKMPRTLNLPQGPLDGLPPVETYRCLRTTEPIVVDGRLDEPVWQRATWSAPFVKMDTGAPVSLDSRIALVWDDRYLYAAYRYEDHEIWGTHVEHHDHVYHNDSDAEIFVDGNGVYYELGVNPINTIYEVLWTWLEPVLGRGAGQPGALEPGTVQRLNHFLSLEDFFYFLPRMDERLGRIGEKEWELPGLKHAVQVDGSLNCPEIVDNGWTVEFALPWEGLKVLGNPNTPPKNGDVWRIGASRCQHFHDAGGNNTSLDWSWNRHGYINMHIPERWTEVTFVDEVV